MLRASGTCWHGLGLFDFLMLRQKTAIRKPQFENYKKGKWTGANTDRIYF